MNQNLEFYLTLLRSGKKGVEEWNSIREKDQEVPSFEGINLAGANLEGADFTEANLMFSDLKIASTDDKLEASESQDSKTKQSKGMNFEGSDLRGINLRQVNLQRANLSRANLKNAKFIFANFEKSNLEDAQLNDLCFGGARFRYANLKKADLSGSDLNKADFSEANLHESFLNNTNLAKTIFVNAVLSNSFIKNSKMIEADLSDADLSYANLSETNLLKANLTKSNLHAADLSRTNLKSAKLKNADLTRANLSGSDLKSSDLTGADLWKCDLSHTRITDAKFKKAELSKTDLSGALTEKSKGYRMDSTAMRLPSVFYTLLIAAILFLATWAVLYFLPLAIAYVFLGGGILILFATLLNDAIEWHDRVSRAVLWLLILYTLIPLFQIFPAFSKQPIDLPHQAPIFYFVLLVIFLTTEYLKLKTQEYPKTLKKIDRLEKIALGSPLDNYSGFIAARICDENGDDIQQVNAGGNGQIAVQFLPEKPPSKQNAQVKISAGNDTNEVNFDLLLDCAQLKIPISKKAIRTYTGEKSPELYFPFKVVSEIESAKYEAYVQVFQRNRLIQVLPINLRIVKSKTDEKN